MSRVERGELNKMITTKQKKGVSEVVGYTLLVVFAVVISVGVYSWLKSYVPAQTLSCNDGVSVFVEGADFNSTISELRVTVRNNGRFDFGGYFIQGSNNSTQQSAQIDLSKYINETGGGIKFGNAILFSPNGGNSLSPGEEKKNIFEVPGFAGNISSVIVIPVRFQEENNRQRLVSCSTARVVQFVGAPINCVQRTCSGLNYFCGTWSDGCGSSLNCGVCNSGFFCDAAGQCISNSCTPKVPPTLLGVCGSFTCGTAANGTCGQVNCGTCGAGFSCNNQTQLCVTTCGNGIVNSGEQCDGTNLSGQTCVSQGFTSGTLLCNSNCQFNTTQCSTTIGNGVCDAGETCAQEPTACQGHQATCSSGNICISGSCQSTSGGVGCTNYCISLLNNPPYTSSTCTANNGQCTSNNGTLQAGGNSICTQQNPSLTKCCCFT